MYTIVNGQIERPGASVTSRRRRQVPVIYKKCRQILVVCIILFIVYVFTCGKCRELFNKLKTGN